MNKYVKTLFSIIIAGFLFIACEPVNEPRLLPALGDEPLSKEFCVSVNGVKAAVEKMAKLIFLFITHKSFVMERQV